ncbi:hypothetical protein LWI29_023277 [Acer saccharum]|uniref:Uncharacterized protein n=1 Tax=Acer saccharum TaxID=4024 RepID=A0AA39SS50_ACESA|nr:hypothetical protein LWI29_023277 [Acer saccharum]
MESQVGNLIQNQNVHFKGASAGGKNIVAKAPRKGALSGRKPLGDLSNSIQPTPNQSIKKQNSSMFSFTEKEKLTFDGNKKKTSGRKALSDTSNSRKQQLNEAPKKNLSTKFPQQAVNRENEEASHGDQDRGVKRTNDESEITRGVVGGSKGKKRKLEGVARLSKQIDHLVEVVESRSTTTSTHRSSQGTSIAEVMEVVATLPGAEKGSQLWWFATELFCSQEKREMFSVMTNPDLKLQFLILNQTKGGN